MNHKMKLRKMYIVFFLILLLFEVIVVGKTLTAGTIQPVAEVTQVKQPEQLASGEIGTPQPYTLDEALTQLNLMKVVDSKYADILEKKSIYPEKVLINLANNSEMLSYVLDYPGEETTESNIILTNEEIKSTAPLFLQWDKRWGYISYGDNNIACSGCGPTALSMVIVGLTHNSDANPAQVAKYATKNHYYQEGVGTSWELMGDGVKKYGLESRELILNEKQMKKRLKKGNLIICSMKKGDFTTEGHFIVIRGYDENGFIVNDPFCIYRSNQRWSYESLIEQMNTMWTISKAKGK